jgi:hypothetical protein
MHSVATLYNTCTKNGYTLDRWKTVQCLMLEKIPGLPRLDKIRVIQIFEADLNLTLGILWGRKMIQNGEKYKKFGNEQWGSRPGKQALDPALLKKLTYDYAHSTRTNLATFDNDAKACYDRIIMPLAALRAQQMGLSQETTNTLIYFLQLAKYYVTTGHGTSTAFYTNRADHQLHGPGQGSRAAPAIWLIVSTLLIEVYKLKASQLTLTNPDNTVTSSRHTDAYVDDATIFCNQQPTNLKQELQRNAQIWENAIHGSGGALELSKCFYYIIEWTFEQSGKPSLLKPTSDPIIITTSSNNKTLAIEEKSVHTAHRTLGVRIAPDGTWFDETKHLQTKADKFATQLRASTCRRDDARIIEACVYRPSLTYSLEITTLDKATSNNIQTHAIQEILSHSGFNRNLPRAIVYGPKHYGGLGFTDLYTEQGIAHIHSFIRHTRA